MKKEPTTLSSMGDGMALKFRPHALQHGQHSVSDPSRYERICARCGVTNPFVNRICVQCGASMVGTPPASSLDVPAPRPPSQLGSTPSLDINAAGDPAKNSSHGGPDDEARWATYWQRVSGQTSPNPARPMTPPTAPRPPAAVLPATGGYDFAVAAPSTRGRSLRRRIATIAGSWVGVCLLTMLVGLSLFGASSWKTWHDRQSAQRQALHRQANGRRTVQRGLAHWPARGGKAAMTRHFPARTFRRGGFGRTRMAQTRSARPEMGEMEEPWSKILSLKTPSWLPRLRWVTNFWRGFESHGRNAGQIKPVYTHAVRDWDRKHNRRHLEIRND